MAINFPNYMRTSVFCVTIVELLYIVVVLKRIFFRFLVIHIKNTHLFLAIKLPANLKQQYISHGKQVYLN